MSSDYYLSQVECRTYEDNEGRWWIDPSAGNYPHYDEMEGPYATEAEVDSILWERALAGDFINVP